MPIMHYDGLVNKCDEIHKWMCNRFSDVNGFVQQRQTNLKSHYPESRLSHIHFMPALHCRLFIMNNSSISIKTQIIMSIKCGDKYNRNDRIKCGEIREKISNEFQLSIGSYAYQTENYDMILCVNNIASMCTFEIIAGE